MSVSVTESESESESERAHLERFGLGRGARGDALELEALTVERIAGCLRGVRADAPLFLVHLRGQRGGTYTTL